jgi:hypothetical protein
MAYYIVKVFVTAIIVVLVAEISKRSTVIGALLASLPLVSILAFIWLYIDTKDAVRIAELSSQILWLVIPSLLFFVLLPVFLKSGISFPLSMIYAIAGMLAGYGVTVYLFQEFRL